jgi:DNA-directed RNA polymerase alpha subunit
MPTKNWNAVPLSAFGLSVRALRTAECAGADTVSELCDMTAEEVLAARGFAETSLREIEAKLAEHDLRLRRPEEPAKLPRKGDRRLRACSGDAELQQKLVLSLAELELPVRAVNALESAGMTSVRDIVIRSDEEMLELPDFNVILLNEIKRRLAERGLHLGMRLVE